MSGNDDLPPFALQEGNSQFRIMNPAYPDCSAPCVVQIISMIGATVKPDVARIPMFFELRADEPIKVDDIDLIEFLNAA